MPAMALELRRAAPGADANQLLRTSVSDLKAGDPLAGVSIVVSSAAAVAPTRQLLASHGVAAVATTTLSLLARQLMAGTPIAARSPVSPVAAYGAARTVLERTSGPFSGLAAHPATEQALAELFFELAPLEEAALGRLEPRREHSRAAIALVEEMRRVLEAHFVDDESLMRGACDALASGEARWVGDALVLHAPLELTPAAAELVKSLGARCRVRVHVVLTGSSHADGPARRLLDSLGGERPGPGGEPPLPSLVVHASDAEEEVRIALDTVMSGIARGVPCTRMAVLYGAERPYAALLERQLSEAGLPWWAGAARYAGDDAALRRLFCLLRVAEEGLTPEALRPVLLHGVGRAGAGAESDAPGWPPTPTAWLRVIDSVGTERSPAWLQQLTDDAAPSGLATACAELRSYAHHLDAWLSPLRAPQSWSDRAAWTARALGLAAGSAGCAPARASAAERSVMVAEEPRLPEPEAALAVSEALGALAALDELQGSPPDLPTWRRFLGVSLRGRRLSHGRVGEGLHVGSLASAAGLDADLVVLVGIAEGIWPSGSVPGPLLTELERARSGGLLSCRAEREALEHHLLLQAMAAGRDAVVCTPLGELSSSSSRRPSRWLATGAPGPAGRQHARPVPDAAQSMPVAIPLPGAPSPATSGYDGSGEELPRPVARVAVGSTARALLAPHVAFSPTEYRLGALARIPLRARASSTLVQSDPVLAATTMVRAGRHSARFTRYDGNVGPAWAGLAAGAALSVTQLETWAECPLQYFFRYVLGVRERDDTSSTWSVRPLERGGLVHRVLAAFLAESIGGDGLPARWEPEHRLRLRALGERAFDALEAKGSAGRPLLAARARAELLAELDQFLDDDEELRASKACSPRMVEAAFGGDDDPLGVLEVPLDHGRALRVQGVVDRVDVREGGSLLVIDYKSGSGASYKELRTSAPDARGTRLQLALYAAAAANAASRRPAEHATATAGSQCAQAAPTNAPSGRRTPVAVEAMYWFVSKRRERAFIGYVVDADVRRHVRHSLGVIADGLAGGHFPARPSRESRSRRCRACDPDGLGTAERLAAWDRKRLDPALAEYAAMAESCDEGHPGSSAAPGQPSASSEADGWPSNG